MTSTSSPREIVDSDSDDSALEIDLLTLCKAVTQRWKLCSALIGGSLAIALAYCLCATPIYRAESHLLIDRGNIKATKIESAFAADNRLDNKTFLTTQTKLLSSIGLAQKVYDKFGFAKQEEFSKLVNPIEAFIKRITAKQIPNTHIVTVTFDSKDPVEAAAVTNYLVECYIDRYVNRAHEFSDSVLKYLKNEFTVAEKKFITSNESLREFRKKHSIVTVSQEQSLLNGWYNKRQGDLFAAESQLFSMNLNIHTVEEWVRNGQKQDEIPPSIKTGLLGNLLVATLEGQKENSKSFDATLNLLNKWIRQEINNSVKSLYTNKKLLETKIAKYKADCEEIRAKLNKLSQLALEETVLSNIQRNAQNTYQMISNRIKELEVSEKMQMSSGITVQIVDRADVPKQRYSPKRMQIMAIVALTSCILAVLLCIFLEIIGMQKRGRLKARKDNMKENSFTPNNESF